MIDDNYYLPTYSCVMLACLTDITLHVSFEFLVQTNQDNNNLGHVRLFTNVGWDHLCESKKNNALSSLQQGCRAEIGSERYAGELAPHGYGTEPDSWHNEDDL